MLKETFIKEVKETFIKNLNQYFEHENIDVLYKGNFKFLAEIMEVSLREHLFKK